VERREEMNHRQGLARRDVVRGFVAALRRSESGIDVSVHACLIASVHAIVREKEENQTLGLPRGAGWPRDSALQQLCHTLTVVCLICRVCVNV
jgi:hypothetical protein